MARETNVEDTELESVINDLLEGQYCVRVVGFNTARSRDVSEGVARELRRRCADQDRQPATANWNSESERWEWNVGEAPSRLDAPRTLANRTATGVQDKRIVVTAVGLGAVLGRYSITSNTHFRLVSKNGGERPLGIPTIRDRVIQTAAKIVIEPIFEADFEDNAYGYRPARGAVDAVKEVHRHLCRGYADVVDADLSKYFDTIPHSELIKSVARRVVDRNVLRLIKMWLRAPIEERDTDGTRRMSGGRGNTRGTPQGGVASPLLANIYMNRFLKHWRLTGCNDTFHAHVVSYADDFVILSRGRAAEALAWTKAVMTKLGLTINEAKTSLRNARQERFDFLGYSFGAHRFEANGNWYLGASPSKKSVQRLKTRIGDLLVPSNIDPWPEVCDKLNRSLRGWSNYFGYGSRSKAYRSVDQYVFERLRRFLARRHKVQGRGNRRFTFDVIHRELGVLCLQRLPRAVPSRALR
jgi:RNA-directed DNA polymerase